MAESELMQRVCRLIKEADDDGVKEIIRDLESENARRLAGLQDLYGLMIEMETLYSAGWQDIDEYVAGMEKARAALQGKATPEGPTHRCMVCGWKGSAEDAGRHADEAHPDEGVVPMVCRGPHQTGISRWIPVAEEDPEDDTLVFVANMDASVKSITIGMFNGQRWRTYNGVGIYVTHWMSLPFPDWPEKGEDAPGEVDV
jgi:hypothetical protein